MKRVLFISSTGGHLSELLQLKDMFNRYDFLLMTEKVKSNLYLKDKYKGKVKYLVAGSKNTNKLVYPFKLLFNSFKSLFIYLKFHPEYIITTGTHTAGPMCYIARIFGSKVIYVETFANMKTKTATGRLVYPISNLFVVQWESLTELYPDAVVGGWIY
ncbi:MAG: polysaccharide biosynthesis protein [Bacilli bacterium]|nr:polysaccharide biosynthesis protein [Bacilli bacterium]MBO6195775.1 polysaccharide biosynthesis protein [Bacilli bacterium]